MATFTEIEKNIYKIDGILNDEDIAKINAFKNKTLLILENTRGISSQIMAKITSNRVFFSVKGGLDYENKEKYKDSSYKERTYLSPKGLKKIVEYFEYNESQINPNWTDLQKCMFLYNALVADMEYSEKYDDVLKNGVAERSLNGILFNKLVCSGFALVYKEMLDRLNIKCHYQNQRGIHSFNIIELDGKFYGVDPTWDNVNKNSNEGRCGFIYFGHDPDFYNKHGHSLVIDEWNGDFDSLDDDFSASKIKIIYDNDEEIYSLSFFSKEELQYNLGIISSAISIRKPMKYHLNEQDKEVRNKYLPIDTVKRSLEKEANSELPFLFIASLLKKLNALKIDTQLIDALQIRTGYVYDTAKNFRSFISGKDLNVAELEDFEFYASGTITYLNEKIEGQEKDRVFSILNNVLKTYFDNYLNNLVKNIEEQLEKYEYRIDDMDEVRIFTSVNIYSKMKIILDLKDYLISIGYDKNKINLICTKIENKLKQFEKIDTQSPTKKQVDIDFLYSVLSDLDEVKKQFEIFENKKLNDLEFQERFLNINYILKVFYILNTEEYSISLEDLQQILQNIIKKANITNQEAPNKNSI